MDINELIKWSEKIESERQKIEEFDSIKCMLVDRLNSIGITELSDPYNRTTVKINDADIYMLIDKLITETRYSVRKDTIDYIRGAYLL
jgi:hypothetical protein